MISPLSKILVIVGTRPEAIKMVPVILALRAHPDYEPIVVSTGQHHRMVQEVLDLAEISPDVQLRVNSRDGALNDLTAGILTQFESFARLDIGVDGSHLITREEALEGSHPAAVLVHGDTTSSMAASLAAFHLRLPVVHVEAGLRTDNAHSPFPEEMNRTLISCLACFHFAPTTHSAQNLIREKIPSDLIFTTGNTGIDALRWAAQKQVPFTNPKISAAVDEGRDLILLTAHRRENWGGGLSRIARAVVEIAREYPEARVIIPLHPNPTVQRELGDPLREISNVILSEPLGYAECAHLITRSKLVVTDSGGIQEEAPSLGKPVVVIRDETERHEGVEAGCLILAGTNSQAIAHEVNKLMLDRDHYSRVADSINPYGDGRAAERIVSALAQVRDGGPAPEPYGSGYRRESVLRAAGYLSHASEGHPEEIESRNGHVHEEGELGLAETVGELHPDEVRS